MNKREAVIEAMAEAIEGCDSPYNSDFIATTALDALHRWADAQGLALAVPREATEGMENAAIRSALEYLRFRRLKAIWPWSKKPHVRENTRRCYTAMIDAAPDVLGVGE